MRRQACFGALLLTATAAFAQDRVPADQVARVEIEKQAGSRLRGVVEMRTTKGAPFSGEAVTEFVQTLADGNRIARRSVTRIYRDSEGRVRREHLAADGSKVESVTIADPLAGTSVVLDPDTRTAYRAGRREPGPGPSPREGERRKVLELESKIRATEPPPPPPPPPAGDPEVVPPVPPAAPPPGVRSRIVAPRGEGHVGNLGERTIEGLSVRGTRTTTVIPASAIGNDQPIRIVSEEWFSNELQVLVQTRHSDPRSGETTYTLTNVVRAEPDRSLFEVPPDYSLNVPTKLELRSRD